jgi:hypothetical protein
LLPEFEDPVAVVLVIAIIGIAGYLFFLATIDVPIYLTRWRAEPTDSSRQLSLLAGLRDASVRWVVTHDIAEWKNEIAWMSLYFSAAVWASLALCVCYSFSGHLPRYRTAASLASRSSSDLIEASKQPPFMAHPIIGTYAAGLRLQFTPDSRTHDRR